MGRISSALVIEAVGLFAWLFLGATGDAGGRPGAEPRRPGGGQPG